MMKKMGRLELLRFMEDWDKASFAKRDLTIMDFIKTYRTKENIYDTDSLFSCSGSLIFCRFVISLQMAFLKRRRVWHYFDALDIFVRSLQGGRYTEEYLRLGGLGFIFEVIRVVEIASPGDKLHACKFLVDLMKGQNGIAVKSFICDNPHFLESMVDSLTMCKDKKMVNCCGQCFENLCIEGTVANVMSVMSFMMRLLPCDFNPAIQSMAFKVLQSVIRLKPNAAAKCVKPILDNLKTEDMDLLIEMSNVSLVILQTESGAELISQLMMVAEGIQYREQFKTVFRPHMQRSGHHAHSKEQAMELRKARAKHERVKQKLGKLDNFMQQAGALFVLNRMMTNKIDYVAEFTVQGILGLSLKTIGCCPHWEVQGQGVTMVQFLHAMSIECAITYSFMLPDKLLRLILDKPAECLRYMTAPICIHLRRLGRFALRLWDRWMTKVITPVREMLEIEGTLPDDFIEMSQMTRQVHEIQCAIQDLLDRPVMESYSKSPEVSTTGLIMTESGDESTLVRNVLSGDEDDFREFRTGKEYLEGGKKYAPFKEFLDYQAHLSEDKLDTKVDKSQRYVLPSSAAFAAKQNELSAMEQAMLKDAEKKPTVSRLASESTIKAPVSVPSGNSIQDEEEEET